MQNVIFFQDDIAWGGHLSRKKFLVDSLSQIRYQEIKTRLRQYMGSVKFLKKQACCSGESWIRAPFWVQNREVKAGAWAGNPCHTTRRRAHFPYCCCSVPKSCPILCNPMGDSTPGFPLLHCLLEFAQTHVHWCYPTISSSSALFLCLQSFPASRSFSGSQLFTSGGQSTAASTSASVLPMNIQGWLPLGLTGLISKYQFFGVQPSLRSTAITLTARCDYWKKHSFDHINTTWSKIKCVHVCVCM